MRDVVVRGSVVGGDNGPAEALRVRDGEQARHEFFVKQRHDDDACVAETIEVDVERNSAENFDPRFF